MAQERNSGADAIPIPRSEAELQAWLREVLPLYEYMELRVDGWGDSLRCSVPLSARNINHLGTVHAGVQFSVAEAVGGLAYFANVEVLRECRVSVREVRIEFIKPATTTLTAITHMGRDELSRVRSELDVHGRAEFSLDIEVRDMAGGLVSRATGRYHLRSLRPDQAGSHHAVHHGR